MLQLDFAEQSTTMEWTHKWRLQAPGLPYIKCYFLHRYFQTQLCKIDQPSHVACDYFKYLVPGNRAECLALGLMRAQR